MCVCVCVCVCCVWGGAPPPPAAWRARRRAGGPICVGDLHMRKTRHRGESSPLIDPSRDLYNLYLSARFFKGWLSLVFSAVSCREEAIRNYPGTPGSTPYGLQNPTDVENNLFEQSRNSVSHSGHCVRAGLKFARSDCVLYTRRRRRQNARDSFRGIHWRRECFACSVRSARLVACKTWSCGS